MGKLIQLAPFRQAAVASTTTTADATTPDGTSDGDLAPIAVLLFVASVGRVAHALWRHEPFDTEPTVALACVIGMPWLAWRGRRKNAASPRPDKLRKHRN